MPTLDEILSTAGKWTLAPGRSQVTFANKTLWGLMTVNGRFSEFAGEGDAGPTVSGRLVIAAASVHTGIGQRDKHLRSADFFDVDNHPDITAQVNGATPSPRGDEVHLPVTLTVRGTTRTVEVSARVHVLDDGALRVTGGCSVQRKDFGVSGNMVGMVGPTTELAVDLVFVRA